MADPNPNGVSRLPPFARSIHCFRGTDRLRPSPRSRARLSDQEKEKVREVRRQGACLRCRMLKIQVSSYLPVTVPSFFRGNHSHVAVLQRQSLPILSPVRRQGLREEGSLFLLLRAHALCRHQHLSVPTDGNVSQEHADRNAHVPHGLIARQDRRPRQLPPHIRSQHLQRHSHILAFRPQLCSSRRQHRRVMLLKFTVSSVPGGHTGR